MSLILNGYCTMDRNKRSFKTELQMYFQGDKAPHISVMWWRIWMSRHLTNGLVKVWRIGYCSHWTSLHLDFHILGYSKNMAYEHKVNKREKLYHWIFDAARHMNDPDVQHKVQINLNSLRTEPRNDLKSKILKHWLNVTTHPAHFICLF